MDTSIETLMRQYGEVSNSIKIKETYLKQTLEHIDDLTRQIRPNKWLNKVDVNDEMFKLYLQKMELIEQYDSNIERLERHKATQSILLNIIKDKEYRM